MVKPKPKRPSVAFWFVLIIFILAISGIVFLILPGTPPKRLLTSSIKEHVNHKSFFSEDKIIKIQDGPYGFQGDGSLQGTFQLSKNEVEKLISTKPIINCPKNECKLYNVGSHGADNPYCEGAKVHNTDKTYDLCVDTNSNQIYWSIFWY
jgi:hypothetical protein